MRFAAVFLALLLPHTVFAGDLTIATFNTEFLTRRAVHVKFGAPLDLVKPEDIALWGQPSFRDQKFAEGAAAVAKVIAGVNADVIVLNEVGDERDIDELNAASPRWVLRTHTGQCAIVRTRKPGSMSRCSPRSRLALSPR
jgi:hypothetical protein